MAPIPVNEDWARARELGRAKVEKLFSLRLRIGRAEWAFENGKIILDGVVHERIDVAEEFEDHPEKGRGPS